MRVKLKRPAFAGGLYYPVGVVESWPDDVPLPSTAVKLKDREVVVEEEPEDEPNTLAALTPKGTKK